MKKYFLMSLAIWGLVVSCMIPAQARVLLVSQTGEFNTIQKAINAAQPGDVIQLSPSDSPYFESAIFHNKSGTKEKPITLDGKDATLDGSDALDAKDWDEVAPGLFKSTALPARLRNNKAIIGRYFFVFNNKINRMGQVPKGAHAPFKNPQDLGFGEWTYMEKEKAFYVRPVAGQDLSSIRAPVRSNGVALSGNCENIIIRNVNATHVWNDGFNIHNHCYDISFINIRAIECGDDGISAHEDCRIKVYGMLSRGNATGFCHIGQSQSETQNIMIDNCLAYGVYLLDDSHHTLRDCIIRGKSMYAVRLVRNTTLEMNNVLIENSGNVNIERNASLKAANISSWGSPWNITKAATTLDKSVVAGPGTTLKITEPTAWKADRNLFDLESIIWNGKTYDKSTFADYVKDSTQDMNSKCELLQEQDVIYGKLLPAGIRRGFVAGAMKTF